MKISKKRIKNCVSDSIGVIVAIFNNFRFSRWLSKWKDSVFYRFFSKKNYPRI